MLISYVYNHVKVLDCPLKSGRMVTTRHIVLDYDSNGNEISKRQIGTATKNFAAMHSNVENKYIDRVVPTWDRWDSSSWRHVPGTDAYEYGEGAGTGRVVWNDDLTGIPWNIHNIRWFCY